MISLLLTVFAVGILLVETRVIGAFAVIAADPSASNEDLLALGSTLVHSVSGAAVLLVVQVPNVYKPRGLTPYGWRSQHAGRSERGRISTQSSPGPDRQR